MPDFVENLRQLHILRGFAALYVAIGHSKVVLWSGGSRFLEKYPRAEWSPSDYLLFGLDMLSSSAQEFVIVFFVLSGFFINYSFTKNEWKTRDFFVNRFVRIVPPYVFSILFSISVFLLIAHFQPHLFSDQIGRPITNRLAVAYQDLSLETFLLSLLFLPNEDYIACNFSYWSLLQEWFFYFFVPFLIVRRTRAFLFFALLFSGATLLHFEPSNPVLRFFFELGIYFFSGVVFFDFIKNGKWKEKLPNRATCYTLSLSLLFLTILGGVASQKPWSYIVATGFTLFAILTLLKYPIRHKGLFRAGAFFGDISYSLYIYHLPFFYLVYAILIELRGDYVYYDRVYWLSIPPVILFSFLMYAMVERRTLVVIRTLKNKNKNKRQENGGAN